jgi:bifunctional DNA-binding transcriptional regulator/antitoxin component of YhaV-PrlF toxin-antitoxin module
MVKFRPKGLPKTRIAKTIIAYGFRTTIPKEIRRAYAVKQGMLVVWYDKNDEIRIHFIKPVESIKELKGSIHGGRNLSKVSAEELVDREYSL